MTSYQLANKNLQKVQHISQYIENRSYEKSPNTKPTKYTNRQYEAETDIRVQISMFSLFFLKPTMQVTTER